MNEIKIFNNPEFGNVRTILIDGEPWFVGNDISKALGYKDLYSALRHNVDNEDKRICPVSSTSGIINESGVYALFLEVNLARQKTLNVGLLPKFFRLSVRPESTKSIRNRIPTRSKTR